VAEIVLAAIGSTAGSKLEQRVDRDPVARRAVESR
jgi:hypothetical protein